MNFENQADFITLRLGIWNGAQTCGRSRLLYRQVLVTAMTHGLIGATAIQGIEGSRGNEVFRTIENEVSSNELPVILEFVDEVPKIHAFFDVAVRLVKGCGVVIMERVDVIHNDGTSRATSHFTGARDGLLIEIYTLESHRVGGKPVYQAIIEYLRQNNIAWVSTVRGMCGFGKGKKLHKPTLWSKNDVPVLMTIVDDSERLTPCIAHLFDMLKDRGLVTTRPVLWHAPE